MQPLKAEQVSPNAVKTLYPPPFASMVENRTKRKLGDCFGLTNFGVNHTTLGPACVSAVKHHHSKQDEFIFILSGTPTLRYGEQEFTLAPGECFGFKANSGVSHQLVNKTSSEVTYLEIGDRSAGDVVEYPEDDLVYRQNADGSALILHKDGTPY